MRGLALLLAGLALAGCSQAPTGETVTWSTPAEQATEHELLPAESHPTTLVIDEHFDSVDVEAIEQAAAGWCALESTLCLQVSIGPVQAGQPNTVWRDQTSPNCPYYGVEWRTDAQISLPDSCAGLKREHQLTTGVIAAHELGHFFGAIHVPAPNTLMNGTGPRGMARCTTFTDLADVCSFHDCVAPRFDLVCTDAEAAASNPYSPFETP